MSRISVVGAGFGALTAIRKLRADDANVPVDVIAPKPELLCIIDSYNKGVLVARTPRRNFILPSMLPLHWVKRYLEWMYLRKYRCSSCVSGGLHRAKLSDTAATCSALNTVPN